MTDTRRRVKLYALNADRQWDDRGTGHVSSCYVERLKGTSLLVRAESDGTLLLESKIQPDTAYQKQQDTLIVWSEGDNFDLALSFQEKAGCDEIWEKICQVQGKDPSVEITQDIVEESEDERFDEMSDSVQPVELPACEMGRLEDISELVNSCLVSPNRKDKLAAALETQHYIKKLLNLFHMCEDVENVEGLHHLYEIFKSIFLLNKNTLFDTMFADDTIFDVVGCLEYDPSLPQPKKHREYLRELAKFREAIPIKNKDLLAKIHQTYRVQYIQEIVLPTPTVFEDNLLSTLSSFIFFNKVEIVKLIEEDEKFLTDLFKMLMDEKTGDTKRRDLVLFLKEFCNFSQNLQPQDKDAFYKTLVSLRILPALEITLSIDDQKTKTASIDILTYIVEFSPSVVRDYTLQQANNTEEEQMLLNIVIEQMLRDQDPELGGAVQLMGVLRILLDPESMLASVNKSEKADFLNFFYKHSIQTLIAPLLENTSGEKPLKEDYHTVQLLGLVLELLSFCVEHHTYHIKTCILNKDLLRRILVLMRSTHTFLVLGALRFMRKIIALKDEYYNRYIIKGNLFAPVIDAFLRNNGRYNLLDSAILELFEFIKLEDIKSLCSHVVENYGKILEDVEYVQTFKALKTRYEQHQDKLKEREREYNVPVSGSVAVTEAVVPSLLRTRYRREARQPDEEEEMWFNDDDELEDEAPLDSAQPHTHTHTHHALDAIGKIVEKKVCSSTESANGPRVLLGAAKPPHTDAQVSAPRLLNKGLVDYDGDSDEEEEGGASSGNPSSSSSTEERDAKRPRLA
ncbi:serine/threonine-protein phosphatase 4 regulatory subunit 3 isoform X1 [Pararge aegeria]|nr:serine/threonine-protein phosphatase 4 regulatory subunit 3 isoform X1 [Pararge aegeria]XP_039758044.1 serine/threonine-protein phosphatase 4 regulatory subunit 3 isoform X1 [Pararge aegeria]XP_039758045.1 serine/threonine-protein phosphatase 4 regulatory subunit 3 isoform X1 [Pararge aegeria]XP_039758046.1 serine/threonine-protein phosphatase 4 regulatory subunit 3 isoform X1 [Pararge aegeria]